MVRPKRDTHSVMPHEDGWQVKRDGDQNQAEHIARTVSQNQGAELQIHKRDMKFNNLTAMDVIRVRLKIRGSLIEYAISNFI